MENPKARTIHARMAACTSTGGEHGVRLSQGCRRDAASSRGHARPLSSTVHIKTRVSQCSQLRGSHSSSPYPIAVLPSSPQGCSVPTAPGKSGLPPLLSPSSGLGGSLQQWHVSYPASAKSFFSSWGRASEVAPALGTRHRYAVVSLAAVTA